MGNFSPVFLALLLNSGGVHIFTAPKRFSCFPFLSYFIFLLAVFFLLWDVKLKPAGFRKLFGWAEFIIEFVVNMMLMEIIMYNFWFPLEMAFLSLLPKVSEFVDKLMYVFGIRSSGILKFMKWHGSLWVASHLLSIFFFLCIIHATRVVDFRILKRCGGSAFIEDAGKRSRKFYTKMIAYIDCNQKSSPGCRKGVVCRHNAAYLRDCYKRGSYSSEDTQDYCECESSSSSS